MTTDMKNLEVTGDLKASVGVDGKRPDGHIPDRSRHRVYNLAGNGRMCYPHLETPTQVGIVQETSDRFCDLAIESYTAFLRDATILKGVFETDHFLNFGSEKYFIKLNLSQNTWFGLSYDVTSSVIKLSDGSELPNNLFRPCKVLHADNFFLYCESVSEYGTTDMLLGDSYHVVSVIEKFEHLLFLKKLLYRFYFSKIGDSLFLMSCCNNSLFGEIGVATFDSLFSSTVHVGRVSFKLAQKACIETLTFSKSTEIYNKYGVIVRRLALDAQVHDLAHINNVIFVCFVFNVYVKENIVFNALTCFAPVLARSFSIQDDLNVLQAMLMQREAHISLATRLSIFLFVLFLINVLCIYYLNFNVLWSALIWVVFLSAGYLIYTLLCLFRRTINDGFHTVESRVCGCIFVLFLVSEFVIAFTNVPIVYLFYAWILFFFVCFSCYLYSKSKVFKSSVQQMFIALRIPAVCMAISESKDLRPGNVIQYISGRCEECNDGAFVYERCLHDNCSIASGCVHNAYRAAATRQCKSFPVKVVPRTFIDWCGYCMKLLIKVSDVQCIDSKDWALRFGGAKTRDYLKAVNESFQKGDQQKSNRFKAFVKREVILGKKDEVQSEYDPRFIVSTQPELSAAIGPWIYTASKILAGCWGTGTCKYAKIIPVKNIHYTSGYNKSDLGKLFDETVEIVGGNPSVMNCDFSRYDGHLQGVHLEAERELYNFLFGNAELNKMLKKQDKRSGIISGAKGESLFCTLEGGRKSGDQNTSVGNSFLNVCMQLYCLSFYVDPFQLLEDDKLVMWVMGDDCLLFFSDKVTPPNLKAYKESMLLVGCEIKAEYVNKMDVNYCSNVFVPASPHTVACQLPGKNICKAYVTTSLWGEKKVRAWLKQQSLMYAQDFSHFPWLADYHKSIHKCYADSVAKAPVSVHDGDSRFKHVAYSFAPTAITEVWVTRRYGVSPLTYKSVEEFLSSTLAYAMVQKDVYDKGRDWSLKIDGCQPTLVPESLLPPPPVACKKKSPKDRNEKKVDDPILSVFGITNDCKPFVYLEKDTLPPIIDDVVDNDDLT